MDEQLSITPSCSNCQQQLATAARFCPKCGHQQTLTPLNTNREDLLNFLVVFGALTLFVLFFPANIFGMELIWDLSAFGLVVGLSFHFRKSLNQALRFKNFRFTRLLLYLSLQAVITFLILNILPDLRDIGSSSASIVSRFSEFSYPFAFAFLSIAIAPPITEELAFRGLLFGQLQKLITPASAVVVTGFLFGLLHFRILGFVWLIPSGIFLSWIRWREGHIWYSVACHFLHNATVVYLAYFVR